MPLTRPETPHRKCQPDLQQSPTAYRPPGVPVDEHNFQDIIGGAVYDFDGDVIGEAWQVYLDDQSTRPQWLTVRTSLFRSSEYFVPLSGAQRSHDGVRVNYGKHTVKGAPPDRRQEGLRL